MHINQCLCVVDCAHDIKLLVTVLSCYHALAGYSLTHTSSVVGRDLESKVTTAHIASIGVDTNLIASTYTQSTFINVCG